MLLGKEKIKYLKVISGDVKYYEEKQGAVMEWLFRYIREGLPEDLTFELRPPILRRTIEDLGTKVSRKRDHKGKGLK